MASVRLFGFHLSHRLVQVCEIEISHMGKNYGSPDLVCENIKSYIFSLQLNKEANFHKNRSKVNSRSSSEQMLYSLVISSSFTVLSLILISRHLNPLKLSKRPKLYVILAFLSVKRIIQHHLIRPYI